MFASGSKEKNSRTSVKLKRRKRREHSCTGFKPIKKAKTSSTYSTILVTVYVGELPKLRGQFGEKYFDYNSVSPECSDKPENNILTTSSSTSSIAARCARGLDAVHSRKLSAILGGSTSTRPGVRKFTFKTCDFIDISNATIPIALGGSTTTSPPIVIVIL
jgi:hypothetical protein